MSTKSDWAKIVRECERQGGRIEQTKKGLMIYPADRTQQPVSIHGTPSDQRAIRNAIAQLRRSGFDL